MNQSNGLEGTTIAQRYELVSLLGVGSFTSVWRAKQLDGTGEVAVKILLPQHTTDPELVDDFINDAKTFVAFRDEPNVATILDCGHDLDTGYNYIAMTLLESNLDQILEQSGPLSGERLYKLVSDIGQALRAIHGAGLVHRDIKATNVMTVPGDDRFVLVDFGVGIVEDSAERTAPTMDMSRSGVWAYASPEKIQGLRRSDQGPASDFYSFGIVLFRAATGQFPFTSPFPQIINEHLKSDPPDPRTLRPDLPTPLTDIILRCLQKNPERRFGTPGELIEAARVKEEKRERVAVSGSSSRKTWYLLGGLIGLLVLSGLIWTVLPKGRSLELGTSPPGATYRLYEGKFESRFDAVEVGETPAVVKSLKKGEYAITFEKDGYFSEEARVDISGHDLVLDVMVLHPMRELRVDSDPSGAEASLRHLAGTRQEYEGGRTPVDFKQLRSGPHELVLRLENYATQIETLFVGRDTNSITRFLVPGELRVLEMFTDPPGADVHVTGVSGDNWGAEDPDQRLTQRRHVAEITPCRIPNLKSGQYRLEFTLEGYLDRDTLVTVLDSIPATAVVLALRQDPALASKESAPVEWPRKEEIAAAETPKSGSKDGLAPHPPAPPKKPRALTPAQTAEAKASIRRTLALYEEALEQRTIRGFARLWISMPANLRTNFERSFEDITSQQLQISEKSIEVDGTRATIRFHELRVVQPSVGREIRADRERVMTLQRLGSGEWLISDLR